MEPRTSTLFPGLQPHSSPGFDNVRPGLSPPYYTKTVSFADDDQASELELTNRILTRLKHPGLCCMISCGSDYDGVNYTVKSTLELMKTDLKSFIQENKHCFWKEDELIEQMTRLTEALALAQEKVTNNQNLPHRAVTLNNLYMDDEKMMKISGFRRRVRTTRGVRQLIEDLPQSYVCKERRELLAQGEDCLPLSLAYSEYKADVYSLGICFLLIAYNLNQIGEDDSSKLKEALALLYDHRKLHYLLTKMLAEEEKDRPDFLELRTVLTTQISFPEVLTPEGYPTGENPALISSIERKAHGRGRNQVCSLCEKSLDSSHPTLCLSCAAAVPDFPSNPVSRVRTRKCKCNGFREGKILLSNDYGEWPADLEVVFLPMGERAMEQDCYEGRDAEAQIATGGKVVKVVLGMGQVDSMNGVTWRCICCSKILETVPGLQLSDSQPLICSPECSERLRQIPASNGRAFICRTCTKPFFVSPAELERMRFASEITNFCSEDCLARWQSVNESIETSPETCLQCQRTLEPAQQESQVIRLECGQDHFFCTKKCLEVYVQEQLFVRALEDIVCRKCGQRIGQDVLALAKVDLTRSLYFARQTDMCQNCRTGRQQVQLNCNHCFCLACVPSYPTSQSLTACPICSKQ